VIEYHIDAELKEVTSSKDACPSTIAVCDSQSQKDDSDEITTTTNTPPAKDTTCSGLISVKEGTVWYSLHTFSALHHS
jgi:hypothetical protein